VSECAFEREAFIEFTVSFHEGKNVYHQGLNTSDRTVKVNLFLVVCKIEEMRNKSTQDLQGGGEGHILYTDAYIEVRR